MIAVIVLSSSRPFTLNKETAKITIDKDGNPTMQVEGIILFKCLKRAYIREKDVAHEISIR